MVIVQSNDRFEEYAELDPATSDLRVLPRGTRVRPSAVRGSFSRMLGRTLVLWNDGRVLRFVVDRREIALTPDVSVHWDEHEGIVVRRDDEDLFRWVYESPAREMAIDMTFMDYQWEDFDFGQFVANRAADVERRIRVFDLGFDPKVLLERHVALDEMAAILEEAFPEDGPRMMEEIWRWWWRWDRPRDEAIRTFCSFCDKQSDTEVTSLLDLRVCTRCRAAMRTLAADGADPPAADRILTGAVRAVRATGAGHADVLAAEVARRCALATPAALPAGTRCSGCETSDRTLARAPGVALCSRCLA